MAALEHGGAGGTVQGDDAEGSNYYEQLKLERGAYYGDPFWNHSCIGQVWGGILTASQWTPGQPVPPDVVAACMAGLKIVRGTHQWCYNRDSYDDATVYVEFQGRFRERRQQS